MRAAKGEPTRNTMKRGRLSEKTKDDIRFYATQKDLFSEAIDFLNSKKEVDAYLHCIWIMEEYSSKYQYSQYAAPHDKKLRLDSFIKTLNEAKTKQDREDTIAYMRQMKPLRPQTKDIYDDAIKKTREVLLDAKVGQERIKKILPQLVKILNEHVDAPLPDEITQMIEKF